MPTSTIITKVNGRDKVIDFRDGLVPARLEDYANLHGTGGSHHAPNSVIKVYVCDYSAGKGEKSRTVSANLTPEVCEQLFEVCKRNIGTQVVDGNFAFFEEERAAVRKQNKLAEMQIYLIKHGSSLIRRYLEASEKPTAATMLASIQQIMDKSLQKLEASEAGTATAAMPLPQHMDFNYTQDRVHNYDGKKEENGYAPVQRLQIWHQAYRKDGALSNYPWTVKIINGMAKVQEQQNGATTFSASTLTNTTEAFIQVSDNDMFKMMSKVNHFVRVWEDVVAADIVKKGESQRAQEAKDAKRAQAGSEE